jgi:hypothetical protein
LAALGATIGLKDLSILLSEIVTPKHSEDATAAQQSLRAACIRMPEREACAEQLVATMSGAPTPTKCVLLEILGAMGGAKALEALGAAAKSTDPQLQDTASRSLGEWMNVDAGPVLLDLAKTVTEDKYKVRALRGYIRLARQFAASDRDRLEMCRKAFDASTRTAEQKLVLEVLGRIPNIEALRMAVKATEVPELKEDGARVALAISQKLGNKSAQVQELLAKIQMDKVKLEIVSAEYGVGTTQKDVSEALRRLAGDLQLIKLPAATYGASFGDPLPGTVKQLRVKYRINGKPGEASFPDNAVILLPMPK